MTDTAKKNATEHQETTYNNTKFKAAFLHPKNWPLLLAAGLLWLISLLPIALQQPLGRGFGRLVAKILPKRVKTARRNLQLSFPDKSSKEIELLVKENFAATGLAIIDTANAWYWPDWRVQKNMVIEGQEHVKEAQRNGNGMLLLAGHFLTLEMCARMFGQLQPGIGVYRPNKNPLMEYLQCRGRTKSNKALLDRKDIKGMLRTLRKGEALWYAPDHDYGRHRSVFVPFFAVEKACTITATSILASGKRTKTYPCASTRLADGRYMLKIKAPLESFPTKDLDVDARICNKIFEDEILTQIPQYMWLHRRFKTRPEGEPSFYK